MATKKGLNVRAILFVVILFSSIVFVNASMDCIGPIDAECNPYGMLGICSNDQGCRTGICIDGNGADYWCCDGSIPLAKGTFYSYESGECCGDVYCNGVLLGPDLCGHSCGPPPCVYIYTNNCDTTDTNGCSVVPRAVPAGYNSCDLVANVPCGAETNCDSIDNNCNGATDEGCLTFYRDLDGDGYGNLTSTQDCVGSCGAGYVSSSSDCNDDDGSINPGATEWCNGIDDDCVGGPDNSCVGYIVPDSPCESDCTTLDNTCHAECDNVNGCNYPGDTYLGYDPMIGMGFTVKEACNLQKAGWVRPFNSTHNVVCCNNLPVPKLTRIKLTISVDPEVKNIATLSRYVSYNGKIVTMYISVWE